MTDLENQVTAGASSRTTLILIAAVALVVTAAVTLFAGPRPARADDGAVTGDQALAERLKKALGGTKGYRAASVALIDNGTVTTAGLGAGPTTSFEIGSVTKPLTGMLLADSIARGEVTLETPLQSLLPGAGDTTLADLASHHSGLPALPKDPQFMLHAVVANLSGGNPYAGVTGDDVTGWARDDRPSGGAGYRYSNLGASVLGQALAAKAGVPWPDLLRQRVLAPLGMTSTTVATTPAQLPKDRADPIGANGRSRVPWTGIGTAPAGTGVWSTSADLTRLVTALLTGDAPGQDATTPRAGTDLDGRRVGLFWMTEQLAGHPTVWHNGGTGGTRTFVGYQPSTGRGVVLLVTTDRSVDLAAIELLREA